MTLQSAGLGRKRISFNKNDDASHLKIKLEEAYPKLASGGGFELLRSSTSPRDLDLIHPPKRGYSVPFLRDSSGLGQAIAYLRPIQLSLDITPCELDDSQENMSFEEDGAESSGPTVKCLNCEKEIAMAVIKLHLVKCTENISSNSKQVSAIMEAINRHKLKYCKPSVRACSYEVSWPS